MKTKCALFCVALAALSSAVANADTAILLIGGVQRLAGSAALIAGANKAIIKVGAEQTKIVAKEITYDAAERVLSCKGAATVSSGERTIKGDDLKIEFRDGSVSVFFLNPEGMTSLDTKSDFESWRPISELPRFGEQIPIVDLKLKTPNKSPEPTPTAVTPRATEAKSK